MTNIWIILVSGYYNYMENIMKIKMLQTRKGTEDGFIIKQFDKDKTYDVRENLGRDFIAQGWAVHIKNYIYRCECGAEYINAQDAALCGSNFALIEKENN